MPVASKRKRTESTRKRESRENVEADNRARADKKVASRARKVRREEAEDDDLLVEREGESSEMSQLRVLTLRLESDNQRMRDQLKRRHQQDSAKPRKVVEEPDSLDVVDVELIRTYMDCLGEEHDPEWFSIRSEARDCLKRGGLARNKRWAKQDIDRRNTIIQAFENRVPKLKMFANHWGSTYLLKECNNNMVNYKRDPSSNPSNTSTGTQNVSLNNAQEDEVPSFTQLAKARKLALQRAVERKAAKLRARAEVDAETEAPQAPVTKNNTPTNDGDMEEEELPEEVRKTIASEEVGVPAGSDAPLKPVPRVKCAQDGSGSSGEKAANEPATKGKTRPVIYMKRGRGGKVVSVGRGASGGGLSQIVTGASEDEELSSSSGWTTSSDADD